MVCIVLLKEMKESELNRMRCVGEKDRKVADPKYDRGIQSCGAQQPTHRVTTGQKNSLPAVKDPKL